MAAWVWQGCHTLLICAYPCLSVGGTSLPECSVCSACSVGTLSLFALLVLQRQLHQRGSILPTDFTDFHRWLGCVIGGVGMAGMPYPPNLCVSVPICGRLSLPEGSVCSAYSVGHSLPVCLVGAAWLVQFCWCSSVGALETSAPPKSAP